MNGHPTTGRVSHTHHWELGWRMVVTGRRGQPRTCFPRGARGQERQAEMARGPGVLPGRLFFPLRGDAEPSAGGGNAIKRPGRMVRRGRPGRKQLERRSLRLNRLFLPYSKSPSCSPCCTRDSSSPKQTTGETSTRPRTAAGKAGSQPSPSSHPVPLRLCCFCFSPTGPRRHQGSRGTRQNLIPGFADRRWGGRSSLQEMAVLLWPWLPIGIQCPPRAALCLPPGAPLAAPSTLI